ncbi:transposase [Leptospira noguchii]|uniref:transposase n=1 Tax=Leptospira noguchii TaxID=28182 RepID=UPI001F33E5B2|nr:transposase [Leptospira noguchii]
MFKNHRSVNHNAKSKDTRYKLTKNYCRKNEIHNQVVEGNYCLVKTAFSVYEYIRPKLDQLYLDEFSFLKKINVLGLDSLGVDRSEKTLKNSSSSTPVRMGGKG